MQTDDRDIGHNKASQIYALLATDPKGAWAETRRALKAFPSSERVRFVSGLVNIARGKKQDARKDFAKCIKMGTPGPDAYLNLAQLSSDTRQMDFALDVLDRAERKFPGDLSVLIARIHMLRAAGDVESALQAAGAALAQDPNAPEALFLRGILLEENGQLLDAISALEALLELHPNHAIAMVNLGRFYAFSNQSDKAIKVTERAYSIAPNLPVVLQNLAIRQRETGDFPQAAQTFRQLMSLSSEFGPDSLRQLADLVAPEELDALSRQIDQAEAAGCPPALREHLEFARVTIAKRAKDDPQYVTSVLRANRLAAKHRPYDSKADSQFHTAIRDSYRAESPSVISPATQALLPATPIFIVGLPRSGTTLLERMLSQGDGVAGLGEVALFNRFIGKRLMTGTSITDALPELRQAYAGFQSAVGPARWTVDKMPANYAHLGWINTAMPEARIILLRRDIRDVALSMFENYFDDPGQNFTFEEQRIQHRIQLFEKTIADWRALGAEFLESHYEDLVQSPEATLRSITDYCDLPFDPEMLNPAENTAAIRTVSSTQARQSVNTKSVARWERYSELLPKVFGP